MAEALALDVTQERHALVRQDPGARERPLAPYYRDYALLQEVTKGALRTMCGSLTLAHTDSEIPGGSVTSFYEVGLDLGLYAREDLVPY